MPIRLARILSLATDPSEFPLRYSISLSDLSTKLRSTYILKLLYAFLRLLMNLSPGNLAARSKKKRFLLQIPKAPTMSRKTMAPP